MSAVFRNTEAAAGYRNGMLFACAAVFLALAGMMPLAASAQNVKEEDPRILHEKKRASMLQDALPVVEVAVDDSMYIVGPGDELSINVFGTQYYNFLAPVNSDGTLVIPELGTVYVRNTTLREVRDKLHALLRREVSRADIIITLSRARQVKVTVSGAVLKPGVVTMPATARVSEALELAGGAIVDTTSLRNVRIKRSNGSVLNADLLRYNRLGDLAANPFVGGGDNIYFPTIDEQVGVFGAVGIEGWMDYVPGEHLYSLLEACQGINSNAFLDSVEVVHFEDDNLNTRSVYLDLRGYPEDLSKNIALKPGDLILLRSILDYRRHKLVLLRGEVRYPGSYSIELDGSTLHSLIRRAGGFTHEASLEESVLLRRPPENEKDQ